MALEYRDLDKNARQFMVEEIDIAVDADDLYVSKRLMPEGVEVWPLLLRTAAIEHDDEWLVDQLLEKGLIVTHEQRKSSSGNKQVAVNQGSAARSLAEGQFNYFYCRAVCRVAMSLSEPMVEIYRARVSSNPRRRSQELVGSQWPPLQLLTDVRKSRGIESALGLNAVNSGLSVRRVS